MNPKKILIKQTLISYSGLIITYIIGFFSIFFLTRVLSVEQYGVYSLLFTFATMLGIFVNIGVAEYINSQFGKFNSSEKNKRFSRILLFSAIIQLIFCIILFLLRFEIVNALNIKDYIFEYTIAIIVIFNLALLRDVYAYHQSRKRLEFTAMLNFFSLNVGTILFVVHYLITKTLNIKIVFFYWLLAVALSNFIGLFKKIKFKTKVNTKDVLKPVLIFSIPLMFFIISDSMINFSSRFIINSILGKAEVAFYTLAYQLHSIIFSFGAFIFYLFLPYIAERSHRNKEIKHYINYAVKYCLMIVIPLVTLLSIMAKEIITLVSGVNYIPSVKFIWFLAPFPVIASLVVLLYNQMWIKEKTKFLGILCLLVSLFNIALTFFLVKYFKSAIGAAIATVVSYLILFTVLFFEARMKIYLDYRFLKIRKIILASLLAGLAIFFIKPETFVYKVWTILLFFVIYILLIIIFNTFVEDEKKIFRFITLRR